MICGNCGNKKAHVWRAGGFGESKWEMCDRCGATSQGVPDVYFKSPYVDEHLSSEKYPGPKYIYSRREKKKWLNLCNLREGGDRIHGASKFDPISHRHAEESLRRK